jgi:hypothetical protein
MIGELLMLAITWGVCGLVVAFWYYLMSRIGTF